jgi:hypothetical protein
MKHKWGTECYTKYCTRNEIRVAWMKTGVWKLRAIRRGMDKGSCPLCLGNEGAINILLSCPETKKWKTEFLFKYE